MSRPPPKEPGGLILRVLGILLLPLLASALRAHNVFDGDGAPGCLCDCCVAPPPEKAPEKASTDTTTPSFLSVEQKESKSGVVAAPVCQYAGLSALVSVPGDCGASSVCTTGAEDGSESDEDGTDASSSSAHDYVDFCARNCVGPSAMTRRSNLKTASRSALLQFGASAAPLDVPPALSSLEQCVPTALESASSLVNAQKQQDEQPTALDQKLSSKLLLSSHTSAMTSGHKNHPTTAAKLPPSLPTLRAQTLEAFEFAKQAGEAARAARETYEKLLGAPMTIAEAVGKQFLEKAKEKAGQQAVAAKEVHEKWVTSAKAKAEEAMKAKEAEFGDKAAAAGKAVEGLEARAGEYVTAAEEREALAEEWGRRNTKLGGEFSPVVDEVGREKPRRRYRYHVGGTTR